MALRRLVDIPEIRSLEDKALLDPNLRSRRAGWLYEPFDEASRTLFGITDDVCQPPEDAEDEAWTKWWTDYGGDIEEAAEVLEFFEARGWDVSDGQGHPLYILPHFQRQLLAGIYGQYGARLPPEDTSTEQEKSAEKWAEKLKREADRFRRPNSSRR